MTRLVYACRFEIEENSSPDQVLNAYSKWISSHYQIRRGLKAFDVDLGSIDSGFTIPLDGHGVSCELFSKDAQQVRNLRWTFPADHDSSLLWKNEVRIGRFDTRSKVEHLISVDSLDYRVAPAQLNFGSPSVIRDLCSHNNVYVGEMQVRASSYKCTYARVDDFLTLLRSPLRRLPIIFLSPYISGAQNAIQGKDLAERLAGVAIVTEASEARTTWRISEEVGRSLSCFNGAVRVYWPGFDTFDPAKHHPYFSSDRLESLGSQHISRAIERMIFGVASFRFVHDSQMIALIRQVQESQRIERREEQKAARGINWEQYAEEVDEQLVAANEKLAVLETENRNLKANQQFVFDPHSAIGDADAELPIRTPKTNSEAVEFAHIDCQGLVILNSALEAARNCPFMRPSEIYDALCDLNAVAEAWNRSRIESGSGGDITQQLKDRGWGKRCTMHISDTTKTKYASDYTFDYLSERLLFEPHITIGSGDANSCASIHFLQDSKVGKIVVAHVGRHLRNSKT